MRRSRTNAPDDVVSGDYQTNDQNCTNCVRTSAVPRQTGCSSHLPREKPHHMRPGTQVDEVRVFARSRSALGCYCSQNPRRPRPARASARTRVGARSSGSLFLPQHNTSTRREVGFEHTDGKGSFSGLGMGTSRTTLERHSVRKVAVLVVGRRKARVDGRGAGKERVWPRAIASRNREAGAKTTRHRREQVDGGWFVQCRQASQEQRRFRAWVIVFELEERQAREEDGVRNTGDARAYQNGWGRANGGR